MKNQLEFFRQYRQNVGRRIWLTIAVTPLKRSEEEPPAEEETTARKQRTLSCVLNNIYVTNDQESDNRKPAFIYAQSGSVPVIVPFRYCSGDGIFVGKAGDPIDYEIKAIKDMKLNGMNLEYIVDDKVSADLFPAVLDDSSNKEEQQFTRVQLAGCAHNHLEIKGDLRVFARGYTPLWRNCPQISLNNYSH